VNSEKNIKSCTDSELVQQFGKTGNKEIIGELFKRHTHLVLGVCMKYLKDANKAQDTVMEVFEKLLTGLNKHEVQNFKGWLYMVAKNECLMQLRSRKIYVELPKNFVEDNMHDDDFIPPYEREGGSGVAVEFTHPIHLNGEDKERQLNRMEEAMKELKHHQKQCIELFYLQEKSYEEVAEITGYTMKEVKSYIQNGKRNLKIIMTGKHEREIK
jgi:RNA polymerase sigma-70 factor (ECF subfamily)